MPDLATGAPQTFRILPEERGAKQFAPLGANLNVLMVWPRFPASFWGFEGVLEMLPEAAMTPPLGLITVAALCPATWTLRLIDHAFDELNDEDMLWADLVMVSAMHAQRVDAIATLAHARRLGRRTFIGGPWASSEPELLLAHADHVLAGEVEEVFDGICKALENGTSQALYRIKDKPGMTDAPVPRFDLLRLDKYTSMPVQFSRGCPFQCEFCDIITIYGRKPRTKTASQLIRELDTLRGLGWRNEVFIVDDNFIGNSREALTLANELGVWQEKHKHPFSFYTEASIDLADRPELMAAMVKANFMYVFLGIETPSAEGLKESKKFQNLRKDNVQQIRIIQEAGLWVLGGFIVGFDSDDENIFERQREFIEKTAITWAMAGVLQAPPTTALYDRMKKEGRLIEDSQATSNFSAPNFRTRLPLPVLLRGLSSLLFGLYEPGAFFERALRSLEAWKPKGTQHPPALPMSYNLRVLFASMWRQGVRSQYKRAYWRFLGILIWRWTKEPSKQWLAFMVLLSAEHFLVYSREVAADLEVAARASVEPSGVTEPAYAT
jgi:radical SAM superfamily enzyme YgiQ (UPF0313 family)